MNCGDIEGQPIVAPHPYKDGEWMLLNNLEVKVEGKVYYIPKCTTTDFASIPRLFRVFFSPYGKTYLRASILHDFLYRSQIKPRSVADKLFLKVMLADGTPKWKAYLFYYSVRLFGIYAWMKNRYFGDYVNL